MPGSCVGVPRTLQALIKLYLLDLYDDAELDRKKTAALLAGFIIRPDTEEPISNEEDSDDDGIATANWQPGTMQVLLPGEDVKFSDPADVGGSHELFQYRTLTQVASAMGLTYFTVTGDMLKANYSNTRNAMLEFRRRIGPLQQHTLIVGYIAGRPRPVRSLGIRRHSEIRHETGGNRCWQTSSVKR